MPPPPLSTTQPGTGVLLLTLLITMLREADYESDQLFLYELLRLAIGELPGVFSVTCATHNLFVGLGMGGGCVDRLFALGVGVSDESEERCALCLTNGFRLWPFLAATGMKS